MADFRLDLSGLPVEQQEALGVRGNLSASRVSADGLDGAIKKIIALLGLDGFTARRNLTQVSGSEVRRLPTVEQLTRREGFNKIPPATFSGGDESFAAEGGGFDPSVAERTRVRAATSEAVPVSVGEEDVAVNELEQSGLGGGFLPGPDGVSGVTGPTGAPPARSFTFHVPELGAEFKFDGISLANARAQLQFELSKPQYVDSGISNRTFQTARHIGEGPALGLGGLVKVDGSNQFSQIRPGGTVGDPGGGSITGSNPVTNSTGTGGAGTPPVFPGVPDPGPALASAGDPAGAQLERPLAEAQQPKEAFRAFLQGSGINPDSFGGNLFQSQLGPALTALSGLGSGVEGAGDATLSGLLGAGPIGPGRFGRLAAAALPGATANITGQPGFQALGDGGTFTDQGALLANLSRLSRGISPFASQFVNPSNADLEQQLRDFTFAQNTGTGGPVPKFSDFLNQAFRPLQGQLSQGLRAQAGF